MTSITDFYAGKNVFVTGATGFMGKVLVEKLLRSCPTIGSIYLLVRPKKGKDGYSRIQEILDTKLFDIVREKVENFKDKVTPIAGDLLEDKLGISEEDEKTLVENVHVVFHSAATVRFNEVLKLSLQMNVLGLQRMLVLGQKIKNLVAFVHVSTAYANCDREDVTEFVSTPPIHPNKLLDAASWMDDEVIDKLTPRLIKPRPNTYTYTKALAEYLVIEERGTMPCCIVRPSIVGASVNEPFPGWIDNFNGPAGSIIAIGKGLLRCQQGLPEAIADIVPVDMATNLMLASAWYTALENPTEVSVYNCTTGQVNPLTWGHLVDLLYIYLRKTPVDNVIRVPHYRFGRYRCRLWYLLVQYLDHYLPAYLMDLGLQFLGKKPIMMRIQNRILKSTEILEYFSSHNWNFSCDNVINLSSNMCEDDLQNFNFDASTINWNSYIANYVMGLKLYALKEKAEDIPKTRAHLRRLQRRNKIMSVLGFMLAWRLLMTRFEVARDLYTFLMRWVLTMAKRLRSFVIS